MKASFISMVPIPRFIREYVVSHCLSCATCAEVSAKQTAFERLHAALETERDLQTQLTEAADESYTLRKALDLARSEIVALQERNFLLLGRVALGAEKRMALEAECESLGEKVAMLDKLAEPQKLYSLARMRQLNSTNRRKARYGTQ